MRVLIKLRASLSIGIVFVGLGVAVASPWVP